MRIRHHTEILIFSLDNRMDIPWHENMNKFPSVLDVNVKKIKGKY